MNRGKLLSGIAALSIYLGLIFLILFFYNIHKTKARNYVKKNSDRVTVTLVNSDKTVLNRSDKVSNKNRPTPVVPLVPLKKHIKKIKQVKKEPKKTERTSKVIPRPKPLPKKTKPKKVAPKKEVPKKVIKSKKVIKPKKTVPKKIIKPKKVEPKKNVPKKVIKSKKVKPKKEIPKKVIKPKKVEPKKTKSAKDLFSSVKTKDVSKHPIKKRPTPPKKASLIKHNTSISDRIKSSHQSGTVSNANREKGIENAYIAKVKRSMNNWDAASEHKGQHVTINLTIYNSGKFTYRIVSGGYGNIQSSLRAYLNTLNRIGLGRHNKSTPYSIQVSFTVR